MPSLSARCVRLLLLGFFAALTFSSCTNKYYRQRVMFQLTDEKGQSVDTSKLRIAVNRAEKNYRIQPNDYLEVHVYTNNGEKLIDPNGELPFGRPAGAAPSVNRATAATALGGGGTGTTAPSGSDFLVQADGAVMLPMVNRVKVSGLSLLQADSVLKISYTKFYKEVFVTTRVSNNRVFVLGAPGGRVIPLQNDNMNLLEVLALAGGIDGNLNGGGGGSQARFGGRSNNIRIIRGDLKNPQVQQIDLSTLDGMRRANLQVEPNDVIYIQPIRRAFLETLSDAAPVLSATAIILQTALIINSLIPKKDSN